MCISLLHIVLVQSLLCDFFKRFHIISGGTRSNSIYENISYVVALVGCSHSAVVQERNWVIDSQDSFSLVDRLQSTQCIAVARVFLHQTRDQHVCNDMYDPCTLI